MKIISLILKFNCFFFKGIVCDEGSALVRLFKQQDNDEFEELLAIRESALTGEISEQIVIENDETEDTETCD